MFKFTLGFLAGTAATVIVSMAVVRQDPAGCIESAQKFYNLT